MGKLSKKDDNAHVEQKNWTHVRKLLGWERYDSTAVVEAINDLYRHELRLWMNLYHEIEGVLPFRLLGVDSDNGSEFINWHLKRWCEQKQIQLTRGRP